MGYMIIHDLKTGTREVLGDVEQARKAEGLPYVDQNGRRVSQSELDEIDRAGE